MDISLDLLLPRETATVPATRKILDSALRALGVDARIRDDIEVMLTEACTNVIRHARHGDDYTVRAQIHDRSCMIKVIDSGGGFDAEQVRDPDPVSEHGRGLMIMRSLADDVRFRTASDPGDGTLVALEKHLDYDVGSIGRQLAGVHSPEP